MKKALYVFIFIFIFIFVLSAFECISKDTSTEMRRIIGEYEFENDSIFCKLRFDQHWDKMKIDFFAENKFNNVKYKFSGKSQLFIHALNSSEVFIDATTGDSLLLNQFYFGNIKSKNNFAIAIDALAGKAFIFAVKDKALKNIGRFGMLAKVLDDTTRLTCTKMLERVPKVKPISYWINYKTDKTQVEDYGLYMINDVSAVFKKSNEKLNNFHDIHNEICLQLLTEQNGHKCIPKIFKVDEIGAVIPSKIEELSFYSHKYFIKYESEEVNIYISASDYSILILESVKSKQLNYMFLVGQYAY